jgi:uncharacterized protein YutE (UPF0331/DUF86 family)
MRRKRYLEKLEMFETEMEFIRKHTITDDILKRALLYALQVCIDIGIDCIAMVTKDSGLVVEDDYSNIEKLENEKILVKEEAELIRKFNGLRNAIVHKYNHIDLSLIEEGLEEIEDFYEVLVKLIGFIEKK